MRGQLRRKEGESKQRKWNRDEFERPRDRGGAGMGSFTDPWSATLTDSGEGGGIF